MDCPDAIMDMEESSTKDQGSKDEDEDKEVLRTVTVPRDLTSMFLKVAKDNSDKNIETLGTLGGQLYNNKFRVTHLLIPKQTGLQPHQLPPSLHRAPALGRG